MSWSLLDLMKGMIKKEINLHKMTEKKKKLKKKKTSFVYLEEDCACSMAEGIIFEL